MPTAPASPYLPFRRRQSHTHTTYYLLAFIGVLLASIILRHFPLVLKAPYFSIDRLRAKSYITMSGNQYEQEQKVAIAAVLKACDVAQATFQKLVKNETVTKSDKSPVTGTCQKGFSTCCIFSCLVELS